VDFQHGLQGPIHFAYSSWQKAPHHGYEMFPQYLWTWGKSDAQNIRNSCYRVISPDKVITGGFPWLNMWGNEINLPHHFSKYIELAKSLCNDKSRAILVTFQGNDPYSDLRLLFQAIKESPPDWQWLLRLHPSHMKDYKKIKLLCQNVDHQNINIKEASTLPLYALLKTIDIHITWWSTIALECIPFGIRTIILHKNGRDAFSYYLEKNNMVYASKKDEIIRLIEMSERLEVSDEAERLFAGIEATNNALDFLLNSE
jgi:hypothetical protein